MQKCPLDVCMSVYVCVCVCWCVEKGKGALVTLTTVDVLLRCPTVVRSDLGSKSVMFAACQVTLHHQHCWTFCTR